MTRARPRSRRETLWRLLAMGCVLAALTASAGGAESIVYYQVTYASGRIRDLSEVPAKKDGVRRVVRISRIEGPDPGYSISSVDRGGISFVETGRTIRSELRWSGKAWVGQAAGPATQPGPGRTPPGELGQQARQAAAKRVKEKLKAGKDRLAVCERAVVQAAAMLALAKDAAAQKPAMLLLEKAQAARQECLKKVVQLEGVLFDLSAGAARAPGGGALPRPTGEVSFTRPAELPGPSGGTAGPIRERRVLPYRTQVWKLDRATGRRTYTVSMAHPEAGRFGAFYYVAYADTDGDGTPDTLVARSPLACADAAGAWSRWAFTTAAGDVFVGNAWPSADAAGYCRRVADAQPNCQHMGTDVYVSGYVGGIPAHKWSWPYLTNIRIHVNQD